MIRITIAKLKEHNEILIKNTFKKNDKHFEMY